MEKGLSIGLFAFAVITLVIGICDYILLTTVDCSRVIEKPEAYKDCLKIVNDWVFGMWFSFIMSGLFSGLGAISLFIFNDKSKSDLGVRS